ncbi:hypothetical protein [Halobacillus sp. H74]|uniref:hypothetical protein n=1 Tax=Halobacillus sp. H74 TaxID=3457436 RepID=UPI003FCEA998
MKLNVFQDGKRITFKSIDGSVYGFTEYTKESWRIIGGRNWYVSDKDIKNKVRTYIYTGSTPFTKRYKKLYEVVMCIWYGKKKVDKMRDNKFIIEHLDNNPHNCSIENLAFADEDLNKSKAFSFDKTRPKLLPKVAINIYKNFITQEFEITLGFNQLYALTVEENNEIKRVPLNALYLKYHNDFETMLVNANLITNSIKKDSQLNVELLNCYEYEYVPANFVMLPPDDPSPAFIDNNGKLMLLLNEKTRLSAVSPTWKRTNL